MKIRLKNHLYFLQIDKKTHLHTYAKWRILATKHAVHDSPSNMMLTRNQSAGKTFKDITKIGKLINKIRVTVDKIAEFKEGKLLCLLSYLKEQHPQLKKHLKVYCDEDKKVAIHGQEKEGFFHIWCEHPLQNITEKKKPCSHSDVKIAQKWPVFKYCQMPSKLSAKKILNVIENTLKICQSEKRARVR